MGFEGADSALASRVEALFVRLARLPFVLVVLAEIGVGLINNFLRSDAMIQGVDTPAGVFFVAGSLYQYRPNETGSAPELVKILAGARRGAAGERADVGRDRPLAAPR